MSIKQEESKAKKNFKDQALGRLNIKLVENQMGQGMSDMICINRRGTVVWMEAKHLDAWPKRATTLPLRLCFEPGQIPFLKEWVSWNGHGFVLLRVIDEFYLLHPKGKFDLVDMTQAEVKEYAIQIGVENIIKFLEAI